MVPREQKEKIIWRQRVKQFLFTKKRGLCLATLEGGFGMEEGFLFKAESQKSINDFIDSLKRNAAQFNYYVRHVFNKREEYEKNGVKVDDHFQAFQVMVCAFNYKGLQKNIERLAVLLPPKQIAVYSKNGATIIAYLPFSEEFIRKVLPGDEEFAINQSKACQRIVKLIKASV